MKMVSWNHIYELSVRTVPKFSFSSHFNNIRSFKFIFQVLCDILGEGHTRVFIQLVSFSIFSRCPLCLTSSKAHSSASNDFRRHCCGQFEPGLMVSYSASLVSSGHGTSCSLLGCLHQLERDILICSVAL